MKYECPLEDLWLDRVSPTSLLLLKPHSLVCLRVLLQGANSAKCLVVRWKKISLNRDLSGQVKCYSLYVKYLHSNLNKKKLLGEYQVVQTHVT